MQYTNFYSIIVTEDLGAQFVSPRCQRALLNKKSSLNHGKYRRVTVLSLLVNGCRRLKFS